MFDVQYVVPVLIGTPPQNVYLNLDTGSSDLWTLSTDTYQAHINGHQLFNPRNSSTSQRLEGESWQVLYGDGAGASGVVYTDAVAVGGTYFSRQAVQSAIQVSNAISADTFSSGILGMANSGANTVRPTVQRTYIENIQSQLVQPLFTVNLQKGRPGNYNFGYINQTEFQAPLQYAPINQRSPFYEIAVSGYQVGATGQAKSRPWNAIVDTGTTLLLMEDDIVDDYYKSIPGAGFDVFIGMYVVPCDAQLPDFYFTIDSYKGRIPGSYINYTRATETKCYGGLQSNEGMDVSIIGDVLIKAQFVVFDLGRLAVGFANKPTI